MMHEEFSYPARIQRDQDGFFLVTFPDFPEAATDGESLIEALHNAADALEETIAGRINRDEPIPQPGQIKSRQHRVPVPAQVAVKAALYMAVRDAGIKNTELAKRLGADEKEVRRLLDPHHRSKLPRLEAALEVLGRKLVIGVEKAAGQHS
jgi:antitoxin HicB